MEKSTLHKGLLATFASATLIAGGMAAPASAAETTALPTYSCDPGEGRTSDTVLKWSVDCSTATPSVIAQGADAILGLLAPDLGIKLGDLNKAIALPLDLGSQWNPSLLFPGSATISGSGFASAMGVGGTGTAIADYVLSGAIGIGGLGATGLAHANLGGFALAAGIGDAQANAKALPGGIALAVGLGNDATAIALGGVAAASGNGDLNEAQSICTAVYGSATVTDPTTGANLSSCTSVLFIFQKSQEGDGPVVYAIKNPLSLALGNPLKVLADFSAVQESLGIELPISKEIMELLGANIIPKFTDDLIRIVMSDDGPKIETDLFGAKGTVTTAKSTVVAAKSAPTEAADAEAPAAAAPGAAVGTEEVTVNTPAESDGTVEAPTDTTPTETGTTPTETETTPTETETAPSEDETVVEEAPAQETPADETPEAETPADETPADETPADETPADETPADETPADETPADETPADETPADETPATEEDAASAAA
ncbi:hypothetical protein L5G28_00815 [Gordonia sp. HY285]|uniref:hypothetical protein n=1 Tax=Gordonia liuliyuniae TaxID=2911517 RepID=UPI001F2F2891|nr:hypothetical protein [Gordonia liuliyuniae]MCF8608708.1 hypothetical protein [Gordonia liuliyuniae]